MTKFTLATTLALLAVGTGFVCKKLNEKNAKSTEEEPIKTSPNIIPDNEEDAEFFEEIKSKMEKEETETITDAPEDLDKYHFKSFGDFYDKASAKLDEKVKKIVEEFDAESEKLIAEARERIKNYDVEAEAKKIANEFETYANKVKDVFNTYTNKVDVDNTDEGKGDDISDITSDDNNDTFEEEVIE